MSTEINLNNVEISKIIVNLESVTDLIFKEEYTTLKNSNKFFDFFSSQKYIKHNSGWYRKGSSDNINPTYKTKTKSLAELNRNGEQLLTIKNGEVVERPFLLITIVKLGEYSVYKEIFDNNEELNTRLTELKLIGGSYFLTINSNEPNYNINSWW